MAWNGTLERVALIRGGKVIRIERKINKSVDEVWASLTKPNRLASWLAKGKIALRKGGEVYLSFDNTNTEVRGKVTALKAPNLLEFTWATNEFGRLAVASDGGGQCRVDLAATRVRWELSPAGRAGTLLTLNHTLAAAPTVRGSRRAEVPHATELLENVVAGWQTHFDGLVRSLSGGRALAGAEGEFNWSTFEGFREKYAAALD